MISSEGFLSQEMKSKRRKTKLSPEEMAFADLLIIGWSEIDAYIVVGLHEPTITQTANKDDMDRLKRRKDFQSYVEQRKIEIRGFVEESAEVETAHMTDAELADAMSKDTQLKTLFKARDKYTEGSKEWNDIQKMIIDVSQVKKDEIVEEEEKVHYYLPISCGICPYKDFYDSKH